MIIDNKALKEYKIQLQQSITVCSERCLFYSCKWYEWFKYIQLFFFSFFFNRSAFYRAAEVLDGIKKDSLDDKEFFTDNELHRKTISTYEIPYEASLPPLSEYEFNKYQYAKSLFQIRQFDSVKDVLGNSKSPKLYFLRLYAKYLVRNCMKKYGAIGLMIQLRLVKREEKN